MAEVDKMLEKDISRRSFLKATGIGLGVATSALLFGTGVAGAQTQGGVVTESPLPYAELDPEEARLRAHAAYFRAGCSYAVFYALLSMLRDKVGGPYNQIPLRMLGYGRGGAASWGTLCGNVEWSRRSDQPGRIRCRYEQDPRRPYRLVHHHPLPITGIQRCGRGSGLQIRHKNAHIHSPRNQCVQFPSLPRFCRILGHEFRLHGIVT